MLAHMEVSYDVFWARKKMICTGDGGTVDGSTGGGGTGARLLQPIINVGCW